MPTNCVEHRLARQFGHRVQVRHGSDDAPSRNRGQPVRDTPECSGRLDDRTDRGRIVPLRREQPRRDPRDVPRGQRTYGWDARTSYSSNRGELFKGFGHTGFTGTSLWVDPDSETAIAFRDIAEKLAALGPARVYRRELSLR